MSYENASLRYASWDGEKWKTEILEGAGKPGTYRQANILVIDKADVPHIAYADLVSGKVKYATQVDGKWQIETVDSVAGVAYPDRNGLALDERNNPYITYFDSARGVLKLAYKKGEKWMAETVDEGFAGFTSSVQVYEGVIWITYSRGIGGGLKFARRRIE